MYQEYYKLSKDPFRLTPDASYVFAHRSYRKAQAYLQHTLTEGDGFLVVTGRSGTGKSTLVEQFLAELKPGSMLVANLISTQFQAEDTPRMVAYAFGLDAKGLDRPTLLCELEKLLANKPRALLIIDEAQNLASAALEELRMLTNLHVHARPLLQIVLLGQEALQRVLHSPEMEQLHQRVVAACRLEPLSLQETRDYVLHRLVCAGWSGDPVISNAACVFIHRFSQGLPRYIGKLCTRLLLHGMVEQRHRLDMDDLATVVREIDDEQLLPLATGNEQDVDQFLADWRQLVAASAMSVDWRSHLTAEELDFIERNPEMSVAVPTTGGAPIAVVSSSPASPPPPSAAKVLHQEPIDMKRVAADRMDTAAAGDARVRSYVIDQPFNWPKWDGGNAGIVGFSMAAPIILTGALLLGLQINETPQSTSQARPEFSGATSAAVVLPAADVAAAAGGGTLEAADMPRTAAQERRDGDTATGLAQQHIQSISVSAVGPAAAIEWPAEPPQNREVEAEIASMTIFEPGAEMGPDAPPGPEFDLEMSGGAGSEQDGPLLAAAGEPDLQLPDSSSRVTPLAFTGEAASRKEPIIPPEIEAVAVVDRFETLPSGITNGAGGRGGAVAPADDLPVEQANRSAASTGNERIERLLLSGERAIARDRLLFPEEQSALHYYSQVLELDPGNPAANSGLQKITERYGELARSQIEIGQYSKARLFIERGLRVIETDSGLLALQREVEEKEAQLLAMEKRTAQMLAETASGSPVDQPSPEPKPEGFFNNLKALISGPEVQSDSSQLFPTYNR